jgi:hypothetical protein
MWQKSNIRFTLDDTRIKYYIAKVLWRVDSNSCYEKNMIS